ncbi:MAG: FmdB family zinc ribbon protein [Gemmatimonadales bacterium]
MPTYEYKCPAGHRFEKSFPRITSKRHAPCPECGKRAERLISGGTGLVFKGSGFYITDYKRAEKPEKAEKPAEKPDQSGSPAAPTSKPKKDSSSDK